jgi:hypothetical protein
LRVPSHSPAMRGQFQARATMSSKVS